MKSLAILLALGAAMPLAATPVAAGTVQAFALAEATILAPGAAVPASAPFSFAAPAPSARSGVTSSGDGQARLTIQGETGEAVSVSMPETFTVARTDGDGFLTLRAEAAGPGRDLLGGGGMLKATLTDMEIAGRLLQPASTPTGAYQGELVVLIQYN